MTANNAENVKRFHYHITKMPQARMISKDEESVPDQVEGFIYDIFTMDWMYEGAGI